MNPPFTQEEIERRARMAMRAFQWDKPYPPNFSERMKAFDCGKNREEEFWGPGYRLDKDDIEIEHTRRRYQRAPNRGMQDASRIDEQDPRA